MTKRTVLAFSMSAVLSGVLGYAGITRAITDVRAPGFACRAVDGALESQFVNQGNIGTTALNVACPVPDVNNGVQNISTVNVAVSDLSLVSAPTAQRCVSLFVGAGVSCGPVSKVHVSVVGSYTLKPAANADWVAPNFGYISVVLPPRTIQSPSPVATIKGIHAF